MYAWLWSRLPGNTAVRALIATIMFLALVVVLFLVVFPWVERHLPIDETGVQQGAAASESPG